MGINPSDQPTSEINLRKDIVDRIKVWTKKGLTDKEEKQRLLAGIPRKGQINLEAPALNQEIAVDLQPRALAKDEHFREYQNIAGAALSSSSLVLGMILNDAQEPLDRQVVLTNLSNSVKLLSELFFDLTEARKSFIIGRYEDKIQKVLKAAEPSDFLFGDNLKTTIENAKSLEKVAKELTLKPRLPFRQSNAPLNWKSSTTRREAAGQSSYKPYKFKANAAGPNTFNRPRPYPGKKFYTQSQPHRQHRR